VQLLFFPAPADVGVAGVGRSFSCTPLPQVQDVLHSAGKGLPPIHDIFFPPFLTTGSAYILKAIFFSPSLLFFSPNSKSGASGARKCTNSTHPLVYSPFVPPPPLQFRPPLSFTRSAVKFRPTSLLIPFWRIGYLG